MCTELLGSGGLKICQSRLVVDFFPQCPLELQALSSNRFLKSEWVGLSGTLSFPQDTVQTACPGLISCEKWAWGEGDSVP